MPQRSVMGAARAAQHLLPVALVLVAVLELAALAPVPFDTLDVGALAALLGPASYLCVAVAVLWVAFLPPSRPALHVTVLTAGVAVTVTACRGALVAAWLVGSGGAPGWSGAVLLLAGTLLGVGLSCWAVVDVLAVRAALADAPTTAAHDAVQGTTEPTSPVTPMRAPPPSGHRAPTGQRSLAAPRPLWQAVSTPWPRRDESDPDGTLIRPPLQHRPEPR